MLLGHLVRRPKAPVLVVELGEERIRAWGNGCAVDEAARAIWTLSTKRVLAVGFLAEFGLFCKAPSAVRISLYDPRIWPSPALLERVLVHLRTVAAKAARTPPARSLLILAAPGVLADVRSLVPSMPASMRVRTLGAPR